ncbi:response regulator transcription factor [Streptomyces ossamyceticus]|uniref:Response regulator transcription factor n=1 Tax=Streptomyces ossamyceticus TaxID=249581 RepID=A0ABV2US95_9ACTN
MHGRDSLPLLHTFADLTPSPAVLVITEHVTEADARTLLAHGVGGILLHRSAARHLAWALAAVADGSRALSPEIADAVIGGCAAPLPSPCKAQHRVNSLSPREREVLALLGDGLPNRAIGEALHISPDTVKDHVRTLCTKLRAANRIQAARIAWQAGLTAVPA